ncbi:uncharacterized protein EV154DRAFT_129605 [Mucor mucedo]|uniref:uncharacterized protein n=1 Tax=Mucor mucedo TaxID=29922 RepID=UPI0022208A4D|nr:uncharacterized protein EV154DRAFT_129605 [Mucor mucedo]KAI7869269.1 hypothetical protein EV154DRAFT_129605 [Mucor mucedo]
MSETITKFTVLFTAQKQKKNKTWQDGYMKYFSFNKKLSLFDEKGYKIDQKFYKAGLPAVGDELVFDGHLVTLEALESTEPSTTSTRPYHQPPPQQAHRPVILVRQPVPSVVESPEPIITTRIHLPPTTTTTTIPKKRAPFGLSKRTSSTLHQSTHAEAYNLSASTINLRNESPSIPQTTVPQESPPVTATIPSRMQESNVPNKRSRMGLSKHTTSSLHASARIEPSAMEVDSVPPNMAEQNNISTTRPQG